MQSLLIPFVINIIVQNRTTYNILEYYMLPNQKKKKKLAYTNAFDLLQVNNCKITMGLFQ